jgi:hypothetical protein
MESTKTAKQASVQSVAKKIGDQVRKAQSLASSDGDTGFEKTLSSLTRRAKSLQTGLARLPESTDALRASGDKLNASVFLFVEAARKVSEVQVFLFFFFFLVCLFRRREWLRRAGGERWIGRRSTCTRFCQL